MNKTDETLVQQITHPDLLETQELQQPRVWVTMAVTAVLFLAALFVLKLISSPTAYLVR